MSKNYFQSIHNIILFSKLESKINRTTAIKRPKVISLEYSFMGMLNNTGGFFKKSALLGIALSQINAKGYRTITLKSTLMSL